MRHYWDIDRGVEKVGLIVDRGARLGKMVSSRRLRSTLLMASGATLFGRRRQVLVGIGRNRVHKECPVPLMQ
jgi:hypothetical protein